MTRRLRQAEALATAIATVVVLAAPARGQEPPQGQDGSAQQQQAPPAPAPPQALPPPSEAAPPQAPAAGSPPRQPPSQASAAEADRAAVRALERTLVELGGLLLPPGRFEIVPEASYAHSEDEAVLARNATLARATRNVFTGSLTLRLGFPGRLQLEGEFPFVYAQQAVIAQQGTAAAAAAASQAGPGDLRLALTFQAYRSRGGAPDILLNGFWKPHTGRSPFDQEPVEVPLGSGVEQFGGGISIAKALDPIVLLASVVASESVPRHIAPGWLDPGASLGITTSAILAVSPETAISFGLAQLYGERVRLERVAIPGTSRTAAVFSVGLSQRVSRAGFLDFTLGIGLTRDVPRFQVSVAAPLQF